MLQSLQSLLGIITLTLIAFALSENRSRVAWKNAGAALALLLLSGWIFLKIESLQSAFLYLNQLALVLEKATLAGTRFVFGFIGGGDAPYEITNTSASFIFATRSLPIIIVVSALSSLLYYWKVLPYIVKGFAKIFQKTLNLSGPLGIGVTANIFMGMIEAPLLIKPYLEKMSRAELFTLMTTGMATIAGNVLVLYATFIQHTIPNALGQILIASIMSVPASILISRIIIPEDRILEDRKVQLPQQYDSSMNAIYEGTSNGLSIFAQVVGILIVLIALVELVNIGLSLLPDVYGSPLSLQSILGVIMSPLVWLIGIPWNEAQTAGSLMGTKTILNELLAYLQLSQLPEEALSERSRTIMTYAMCGFANLGSLGILISGLSKTVPERSREIVNMGFKSLVAGTLSTLMTGAIVGLLI